MRCVRAVVTGRVQGVSFRWYTRAEARRLGVAGWVRNLPDGGVEVYAEGDPDAVEALVRYLHEGPPLAVVVDVDVRRVEPVGAASSANRFCGRSMIRQTFSTWIKVPTATWVCPSSVSMTAATLS